MAGVFFFETPKKGFVLHNNDTVHSIAAPQGGWHNKFRLPASFQIGHTLMKARICKCYWPFTFNTSTS